MQIQFWTEFFFKEAEQLLNRNPETAKALAGMETSILLKCENRGESFLVRIGSGNVSTRQATSDDRPEFALHASYDEWVKIAKGEEKIQREIVRGKVRFIGSWPKMLLYINKVVRLENEMLKKVSELSIQY